MNINWFPGHMHKASKEMRKLLPKVDLVIEVLDARLPKSSENPMIAEIIGDKPRVKLLNKSDLADPKFTQIWLDEFNTKAQHRAVAVEKTSIQKIFGDYALFHELVPNKIRDVRNIEAMIMGIPNVGKSTIINAIAQRQIAKTGNEPAVTKSQQAIKCPNDLVLFDTPGVLWPKIENQNSAYRLAAIGSIGVNAIRVDDVALYLLEFLLENYSQLLIERFDVDESDPVIFMQMLARQRGCLSKGGVVDWEKVSRLLLTEFRSGKLGPITLETPPMLVEEEKQVQQQKEERLRKEKIEKNNH